MVVVVGASSGVGRATAEAFAAHGCRLVVAARSADTLKVVVDSCADLAEAIVAVPTDITDPESVAALAEAAIEGFGRVDVWVEAAAGVVAGDIGDTTTDEIVQLVATNVAGTFFGARAALTTFRRQGAGTLILVSSLLGMVPNPVVPAYVMSKFAVRGLALSLRQVVADEPGIDVALVVPAPIDTPLFARAANHTGRRLRAIPPAAAPERVAAAIVACARRPRRQLTATLAGRLILIGHRVSPRLTEAVVAAVAGRLITTNEPEAPSSGALFDPAPTSEVQGGWRRGRARRALGSWWGRTLSHRGAHRPRPTTRPR